MKTSGFTRDLTQTDESTGEEGRRQGAPVRYGDRRMDRRSQGHSRRGLILALLGTALLLSTVAAGAEDLRTWSDASGKFRIKAQLLRVEQTKVVLRGEDGGEFEVEFAKLSKADQQYVDAHTPDPLSSGRPGRGGCPKAPPPAEADSRLPERQRGAVRVKYAGFKRIAIVPKPEWEVPGVGPDAEISDRTGPLPDSVHAGVFRVALDHPGQRRLPSRRAGIPPEWRPLEQDDAGGPLQFERRPLRRASDAGSDGPAGLVGPGE